MKLMIKRGLGLVSAAVVLAMAVSAAAGPQRGVSADKQKDIRRLMVLTGSGDLGMQVWDQMVAAFKKSVPQVPESFWQECRKDINAAALIDLCVPIYDKNLSHEDIKELIKFYETPAGKRIVKALPVVAQESMQAGQKWGQEIAGKVVQKLQEKGYR